MKLMGRIFVKRRHAYTGEDIPWQIDDAGEKPSLFRYLAGGGVRAFGVTVRQIVLERRQNRFLVLAGLAVVAWLVLWIV